MNDPRALQLISRVQTDLAAAIKHHDQLKVSTLKSLLASISNAEAVEVPDVNMSSPSIIAGAHDGVASTEAPRRNLTWLDVIGVLNQEVYEIEHAMTQLDESSDYKRELKKRWEILKGYVSPESQLLPGS